MAVDCLLDTNVLVYAACGDADPRGATALELIEQRDFGLSAQSLAEFYTVVTRKLERVLTPEVALRWIEQFEVFPVVAVDAALVKLAAVTSQRHQISYWDAAIVEAARVLGTSVVYSEDLSDGQDYGGVTVQNPFRTP